MNVEKFLGIKLLDSQKQLINKCLEARKNGDKLYICMPRWIGYSYIRDRVEPVLRAILEEKSEWKKY